MSQADDQYMDLVHRIITTGVVKPSRAGETKGVFGHMMTFDLLDSFPLITTKKINFQNVYHELMWFLRGNTNIKDLKAPQLWAPWARPDGDCGPIYGKQWVSWIKRDDAGHWERINQVQSIIQKLVKTPDDRRMIVSAWNVGDIEDDRPKSKMVLPPCHVMFQVYTTPDGYMDMSMYQRSCDTAIGLPYNIASYALLAKMLAEDTGYSARNLMIMLGDVHIYTQHLDAIKKQMMRQPKQGPALALADQDFWDFPKRDDPADYVLSEYDPHPFIKYEVNV